MNYIGFDSKKYLKLQSKHILERISKFDGKLYLEFGGKLFDDLHASRVLPGFAPDIKMKMLLELKEQSEIIIVINASDIEKNKVRGDFGITYDIDVLRLIDSFRSFGFFIGSVIISRYSPGFATDTFKNLLESRGVKVYLHYPIDGYPSNISHIVCDDGYGKNQYVETQKPLVIVTAPGPGSGKMAVCLSQMYHDYKRGIRSGYAKFETFPIWNMSLNHPVNLAYEAATVDLGDINMIDPFHLEAYGKTTINYNRDIEIFPVLNAIFEKITGTSPYKSPTDMGVNMVGECITDDEIVRFASKQEVIRRYYALLCAERQGRIDKETIYKMELLMEKAKVTTADRKVVEAALEGMEATNAPVVAVELPNGKIITGKTSPLLGASAAVLLNALKELGGINHKIHLLSPIVIEPIQKLKVEHLGNGNPRLHTDEILIALSISAATNPTAQLALNQLPKLNNCEVHSSVILSNVDEQIFKKLGMNLTCEPSYQGNKLYHK